jgi:hypothetical protein
MLNRRDQVEISKRAGLDLMAAKVLANFAEHIATLGIECAHGGSVRISLRPGPVIPNFSATHVPRSVDANRFFVLRLPH